MTEPRRAAPPKRWIWLREIVITLIIALTISTLVRVFLVQVFEIPSGSMENTLLVGDRVAVQKVQPFVRGDVVVFRDSQGWLGPKPEAPSAPQAVLQFLGFVPDRSSNYLIKRVIGLPGDHVKCCDNNGRMTVNGKPLDETSYLFKDAAGRQIAPSDLNFDVIVPEGRIFVMGDHRNNSQDSRCYLTPSKNGVYRGIMAFVPMVDVQGSAVAIVLPFNRWQGFSTPRTFTGVPNPAEKAPPVGLINEPVPQC